MRVAARLILGAVLAASPAAARQSPPLAPHQQLAHDIYMELVEINTTAAKGTTVAAQAMAKRFRDAGFADADIFLGGPRDDKHNLVVRYRDERMLIKSYYDGQEFLYRLAKALSGK